LFEATKQRYFS